MIDVAVVIPVYNEDEIIQYVIDDWCGCLERLGLNYEIHCYNDGSKDNTSAVLAKAAAAKPNRVFAIDKPNSGHGPTILLGYQTLAPRAKWIFQIDSDNELRTDEFPALWQAAQGKDYAAGYRAELQYPLPRKVVSAISLMTVQMLYGGGLKDVNCPYRLMRSEIFAPLFSKIPSDTFAPNVLISGLVSLKKLAFAQVPVRHISRQTGEVSIQKLKLLKVAIKSFRQTIAFRGIA
jgi:glycosyltransferase involved in cell wall biosynthesis